MKGMEEMIFIIIEVFLIAVFAVMLSRAVGAVFNPDKEVVTLNTELLRAKINEACQFGKAEVEKLTFPQPKPSKIGGSVDFLPAYAISGSGAADPHYVLYYETFPPGEAIGWEAYLRQDTRYIAPFDYAKVNLDTPLKEKGRSITGKEVDKFFANMTEYEKEVLNTAEKFTTEEIGGEEVNVISYTADAQPQNVGWEKIEKCEGDFLSGDRTRLDIDDSVLRVQTTGDGSIVFKRTEAEPSDTAFMEALVRVTEDKDWTSPIHFQWTGKTFISIHNKPYRADLLIPDHGEIWLQNVEGIRLRHTVDTKEYHTYRLELKGDKASVYVDGNLVMTGKAYANVADNTFLWGAGKADNINECKDADTTSYWDYVNYGGNKIKAPEITEQKYQLAKKSVLINNIVLSDHLNVIPTEPPRPPGKDVATATSNLGNVGKWIGDRYEFGDYFGITKEERAYIKYLPCGDNALCLKTRDAVQRFPLDPKCADAKYIQMDYDARGVDWDTLVDAAIVGGDIFALNRLSQKTAAAAGKQAAAVAPSVSRTINVDALFKGTATEFVGDLDTAPGEVAKRKNIISKGLGKLGSFGKGILKSAGKKSLAVGGGKLKLAAKLFLLYDLMFWHGQDFAEDVLKATLAYKNSEFYLASPCQLKSKGNKITIEYDDDCRDDDRACATGILYPLYEYKINYDGTKTITNVGDHFMCLESIGKDKDEADKYNDKYKNEIEVKKVLPEKLACIKIKMEKDERRDFCWTNNPILPEEKGIWNKIKSLAPDKETIVDGLIGCGIGLAFGGPVGCVGGAVSGIAFNEADKVVDSFGVAGLKDGLKGEAFVRLGGQPVTEVTAYLENPDIVEIGPTDIIGGNAAKRFGEILKNYVSIDWAWP